MSTFDNLDSLLTGDSWFFGRAITFDIVLEDGEPCTLGVWWTFPYRRVKML